MFQVEETGVRAEAETGKSEWRRHGRIDDANYFNDQLVLCALLCAREKTACVRTTSARRSGGKQEAFPCGTTLSAFWVMVLKFSGRVLMRARMRLRCVMASAIERQLRRPGVCCCYCCCCCCLLVRMSAAGEGLKCVFFFPASSRGRWW